MSVINEFLSKAAVCSQATQMKVFQDIEIDILSKQLIDFCAHNNSSAVKSSLILHAIKSNSESVLNYFMEIGWGEFVALEHLENSLELSSEKLSLLVLNRFTSHVKAHQFTSFDLKKCLLASAQRGFFNHFSNLMDLLHGVERGDAINDPDIARALIFQVPPSKICRKLHASGWNPQWFNLRNPYGITLIHNLVRVGEMDAHLLKAIVETVGESNIVFGPNFNKSELKKCLSASGDLRFSFLKPGSLSQVNLLSQYGCTITFGPNIETQGIPLSRVLDYLSATSSTNFSPPPKEICAPKNFSTLSFPAASHQEMALVSLVPETPENSKAIYSSSISPSSLSTESLYSLMSNPSSLDGFTISGSSLLSSAQSTWESGKASSKMPSSTWDRSPPSNESTNQSGRAEKRQENWEGAQTDPEAEQSDPTIDTTATRSSAQSTWESGKALFKMPSSTWDRSPSSNGSTNQIGRVEKREKNWEGVQTDPEAEQSDPTIDTTATRSSAQSTWESGKASFKVPSSTWDRSPPSNGSTNQIGRVEKNWEGVQTDPEAERSDPKIDLTSISPFSWNPLNSIRVGVDYFSNLMDLLPNLKKNNKIDESTSNSFLDEEGLSHTVPRIVNQLTTKLSGISEGLTESLSHSPPPSLQTNEPPFSPAQTAEKVSQKTVVEEPESLSRGHSWLRIHLAPGHGMASIKNPQTKEAHYFGFYPAQKYPVHQLFWGVPCKIKDDFLDIAAAKIQGQDIAIQVRITDSQAQKIFKYIKNTEKECAQGTKVYQLTNNCVDFLQSVYEAGEIQGPEHFGQLISPSDFGRHISWGPNPLAIQYAMLKSYGLLPLAAVQVAPESMATLDPAMKQISQYSQPSMIARAASLYLTYRIVKGCWQSVKSLLSATYSRESLKRLHTESNQLRMQAVEIENDIQRTLREAENVCSKEQNQLSPEQVGQILTAYKQLDGRWFELTLEIEILTLDLENSSRLSKQQGADLERRKENLIREFQELSQQLKTLGEKMEGQRV